MDDLLVTPPLSPNVVCRLDSLSISSKGDLRRVGAVFAFLLLKASGLTVTRSVLWSLDAVLSDVLPDRLPVERKRELLQILKAHPPVAVFPDREEMQQWMRLALLEAGRAAEMGEVPVGAVVVFDGQVIGRGFNQCVGQHQVAKHAELVAIAQAGNFLGSYRLENCDLYVTLEPCPMCAGAIIQSRIRRLVFGALEPKMGAAGSVLNLFADRRVNTHTSVLSGIETDACQQVLQDFFRGKRRFSG